MATRCEEEVIAKSKEFLSAIEALLDFGTQCERDGGVAMREEMVAVRGRSQRALKELEVAHVMLELERAREQQGV